MQDPGVVPATVIVQLTDAHLGPRSGPDAAPDAAARFRRAASYVRESELAPDAVVLTGDLSDGGSRESYEFLLELIADELEPLGAPVWMIPGNHDHRPTFREVLLDAPGAPGAASAVDGSCQQVHDLAPPSGAEGPGTRVILCDSYVDGAITGRLGPGQLAWLDAQLASSGGRTCVVALHHPAVPRGVPRERDYLLEDRDEFADVLRSHRVAAVLCGHSHVPTASAFAGTVHVAAPSTAPLNDPGRRGPNRTIPGVGLAICTVRDGSAMVNPVVLDPAG